VYVVIEMTFVLGCC